MRGKRYVTAVFGVYCLALQVYLLGHGMISNVLKIKKGTDSLVVDIVNGFVFPDFRLFLHCDLDICWYLLVCDIKYL